MISMKDPSFKNVYTFNSSIKTFILPDFVQFVTQLFRFKFIFVGVHDDIIPLNK